jgi:hypothetical protein
MTSSRSALVAALLAAALGLAPTFAAERAGPATHPGVVSTGDALVDDADSWRFRKPPPYDGQPAQEVDPDTILAFVEQATRAAVFRDAVGAVGGAAASDAERRSGRYVFEVWYRGVRQHSVALVLSAGAGEAPGAWLWTRDIGHAKPIGVADLLRMVSRALWYSLDESARSEVGVAWSPLPPGSPLGPQRRADAPLPGAGRSTADSREQRHAARDGS